MNIYDVVLKTLKAKLKNSSQTLTRDTKFKDLGIDSLDLMVMILDKEEEFGIKIPDEKLLKIQTIGDLVKVIEELTKK